jgi:hypothetical protein
MTSHSPDDEDPLDSAPLSADAITPRGGFMARPGLKPPPRHAVVVRGGDAPESEHIPLLRPSVPPPPPAGEPVHASSTEKITLRAIPTPSSPKVGAVQLSTAAAVGESLPPPSHVPSSRAPLSDAPFVTSALEGPSSAPQSRRSSGSRWTIVAAAAAGLILGLASVAAKVSGPGAAAQPPQGVVLPPAAAPSPVLTTPPLASVAAQPSKASAEPAPSSERAEPKPARAATPSAKRSIF